MKRFNPGFFVLALASVMPRTVHSEAGALPGPMFDLQPASGSVPSDFTAVGRIVYSPFPLGPEVRAVFFLRLGGGTVLGSSGHLAGLGPWRWDVRGFSGCAALELVVEQRMSVSSWQVVGYRSNALIGPGCSAPEPGPEPPPRPAEAVERPGEPPTEAPIEAPGEAPREPSPEAPDGGSTNPVEPSTRPDGSEASSQPATMSPPPGCDCALAGGLPRSTGASTALGAAFVALLLARRARRARRNLRQCRDAVQVSSR